MHFQKSTAKIAASLLLIGALVLPVLAVTGTVNSGTTPLNVRAEANTTSNVLGQLNNGTPVDVISSVNESWYQIAFNGSTGYVSSEYLDVPSTDTAAVAAVSAISPAQAAAAAAVPETPKAPETPKETALSNVYIQANDGLNVRSGPGTGYDKVGSLAKGAVVQALAKCNGWYKISSGYVSADYVTEVPKPTTPAQPTAPSTSKGQQVADFALKYVGYKYVYGGSTPSGFDCSGFTMYVYKQFGISLPHTASGQLNYGKSVSISQLQPGDLVMFHKSGATTVASHVGIYIGGGKFVHASTSKTGVIVSKMTDAYYTSGFVGGRRLV